MGERRCIQVSNISNILQVSQIDPTPNGSKWHVGIWPYLTVFDRIWSYLYCNVYCNVYATVMLLCCCSRNCASSLWLPAEAPMRVVKNGARPCPRRVSQVLARLKSRLMVPISSISSSLYLLDIHASFIILLFSDHVNLLLKLACILININDAAANSTITAPYHSPHAPHKSPLRALHPSPVAMWKLQQGIGLRRRRNPVFFCLKWFKTNLVHVDNH